MLFWLLFLDAIVYVVDSADTDRIPIAKTELMAILNVLLDNCHYSYRKKICVMFVFWCLLISKM